MKIKIFYALILASSMLLLSSCACDTCGYGSYDYNSRCGMPSCTDQYYIEEYSDPCPGPYNCDVY